MQGCCEPQPLGSLPPPGRGQAERQGVSVSILVLGLEHISEMHKTDLELALEPGECHNYKAFAVFELAKEKSLLTWMGVGLSQQGRDGSRLIFVALAPGLGSRADLCHVLKACPGSPPLPAVTRGPSEPRGAPTAIFRMH